MLKSVVEGYPQDDISVLVVWVPMLARDNEAAARKISSMFRGDARVHQFWDPDRLTGISYSRDVFPTYQKDMASSLPPGGPLYQRLKGRGDLPAENAPLWDVAFLYRPGIAWNDKPPKPTAFAKQLMFFGKQEDGTTGRFFTNDFKKPPRNTDWFVELSDGMKKLTKREPKPKTGSK